MTTTLADVICLNCGRCLGEVAQQEGQLRLVRLAADGMAPRNAGSRPRCGRCGGKAWIEHV